MTILDEGAQDTRASQTIDRSGAATLEDVAAAAGVSPATVSRVINGRPVVAEATRQRVLAAVERLNFRPDSLGRGLATRRTGTLGLVIADITNPFYPEIVRGVEQAAAQHGLSVLLYDTAEDSEREAQALRQLRDRRVDGIIVCASRLPEERIHALARPDTPLVLINRRLTAVAHGTVEADHEAGVQAAMDYLVRLGHRRIAYIGGPAASQVQQRRLAAFTREAAANWLSIPPALLLHATPTVDGGKQVARAMLELDGPSRARPSAILAYNDLIAIGVILAAQDLGIAVPEDLSIVGHDDIPLAGMLRPALTTVRQPMRELGAQAVQVVQARLHAGGTQAAPPVQRRLTPELVVRGSTAPLTPSGPPP